MNIKKKLKNQKIVIAFSFGSCLIVVIIMDLCWFSSCIDLCFVVHYGVACLFCLCWFPSWFKG